jgi:hypothetical protein
MYLLFLFCVFKEFFFRWSHKRTGATHSSRHVRKCGGGGNFMQLWHPVEDFALHLSRCTSNVISMPPVIFSNSVFLRNKAAKMALVWLRIS